MAFLRFSKFLRNYWNLRNGLLLIFLFLLVGESSESVIECKDQEKCSDCIQTPNCTWCSMPDFKSSDGKWLERCFETGNLESQTACAAEHLISPNNEIQFLRNEALGIGTDVPVQLKPQHVKVSLRKGIPFNLTLSFRLAENYPIDMYYLMDLSHSMADDKKTVAKLGSLLSAAMLNRTSNFRIGFGSFVDKVVMPFVSTVPYRLQKPCDEREEVDFQCAPPFSYRHTLALTSDAHLFEKEVNRARVSGNLDSPEGGFDAIMQAVVCGDQIGWRKDARKLLMFSTDASFHLAGDGRLGGILEPHDGQCHLNEQGEYTHYGTLDYPSIAQINSKVTEKSIAIIFAVTKDQLKDYERLSNQIQGSTAAELSANSSNLVEVVNHEYEKISSEVKLSHTLNEATSPVKIELYSHCDGADFDTIEGGRCGGVRIGQTVSFTAQLVLSDCPRRKGNKLRMRSTSFVIQVVGLEEQLVVDVDLGHCDCDCEKPSHPNYEKRSHSCGFVGTLQCGACDCGTGYYGKTCECSASDDGDSTSLSQSLDSNCKENNVTAVCSDRGECFCNRCECQRLPTNPDQSYYGKYCQCDDFSCRRFNGQLCSGLDQGKCVCSECQCQSGWTGDACQCSTSTVKCRSGGSGEICNGRGHCECNRCVCDSPDYSGPFCEECQNCPDKCTNMAKCVLCTVHRNQSGSEQCLTECSSYPVLDVVEFAPTNVGKYCSAFDAHDGCTFYYSYAYDPVTHEVNIKAQKVKSCALLRGAGLWWLGGSIVGLIVLVGLLCLLCFWCHRERQAKLEYSKFQDEKLNAKWNRAENPLYRNPNTTFRNPLHESNQKEKYY